MLRERYTPLRCVSPRMTDLRSCRSHFGRRRVGLRYWIIPGSETFANTHNPMTDDGMRAGDRNCSRNCFRAQMGPMVGESIHWLADGEERKSGGTFDLHTV